MTAGIEAPAKDATTLFSTNESLVSSVIGYATLTFSMVFYLPVIEAELFLFICLYGKFHAKL